MSVLFLCLYGLSLSAFFYGMLSSFLPCSLAGLFIALATSGALYFKRHHRRKIILLFQTVFAKRNNFYAIVDASFIPVNSFLPQESFSFQDLLSQVRAYHPGFCQKEAAKAQEWIVIELHEQHHLTIQISQIQDDLFFWQIEKNAPLKESLKSKYDLMTEVIEGSPIGILSIYPDGKIYAHNQMFLDQINKSLLANNLPLFEHDLRQHDFLSLLNAVHSHESKQKVAQFLVGQTIESPIEVYFFNDNKIAFNIYLSSIAHSEKLSTFYVVDISDHKQLSQQLSHSQKMQAIGQLAGGIAHDFNNLLTAMIGYCDLLLLRHLPTDLSFNDIMQIKQNANRATILVRQLLAFSRQQTLQPKIIDVTETLAELSILLQRLIGPAIHLKVVHARDLWLVKVDQGQLEQVIINLTVNARDAMADGGDLVISTGNYTIHHPMAVAHETMPPGEYIYIKVSDTGVGIPPENITRIFDPFFSTKAIGAGTGLGLSTVYGIVKQTGGFVTVDSQVDKGTVFTIFLPKNSTHENAQEETKQETRIADLTGTATILLVEDEDAVRLFSARALRDKGYHVLDVNNGNEALKIINDLNISVDVVITDVVMAPIDGPTLAKHICQHYPDMKIIFMSGYTEDSFRNQLQENADVHFLAKPFSLKDLAGKVKQVLSTSVNKKEEM